MVLLIYFLIDPIHLFPSMVLHEIPSHKILHPKTIYHILYYMVFSIILMEPYIMDYQHMIVIIMMNNCLHILQIQNLKYYYNTKNQNKKKILIPAIFTTPSLLRILAGFKSLWIIPNLTSSLKPLTIYIIIYEAYLT